MPCLNEAETLAICINKANSWLKDSGLSGEILIADNGSTDGSQEIAKTLGARVVHVSKKGYGSALFYGSEAAYGRWIIMGDSDNSYNFADLDLFINKLAEGYDLVMGNRFLGGIADGAMPWKNKYIGNPILTWIGRLLFNCPAKDFHCGLRGFSRNAFLQMDLRTTGMEFASEMVIKANLFGMKIAEVATTLSKDGRSRPPHLKPWRDGWRHLRFMILFSPKWLFIMPGLVLTIFFGLAYISLYISSVQVRNVIFDIHTLFFAQFGFLLGLIAIIFGIITNLIGIREGLLPHYKLVKNLQNQFVLELGLVISIFLFFSGIYIGIDSLLEWKNLNFGKLEYGMLLRSISLSILLMMLGGLSFFTSCILGFLALPTREQRYLV
jgi:glycosyltransferase involved in cell wall biosynthesis